MQTTSTAFSDLDDLLQESLAVVTAKKSLQTARKAVSDTRMASAEKAEITEKIRQWEAVVEWRPAAVVALFQTQACACGSIHSSFLGVFQRQAHRSQTLTRLIREAAPEHLHLPREQKFDTVPVTMCPDCAGELHGYKLPEAAPATAFPVSRSF